MTRRRQEAWSRDVTSCSARHSSASSRAAARSATSATPLMPANTVDPFR